MNPTLKMFVDGWFADNPVFVGLLCALPALVMPERAKTAVAPAIRLGAVFATIAVGGGLLAAALPSPLLPVVVLAGTATGIGLLRVWGELRGEWAGLPKSVLVLAPLAALQLRVAELPGMAEAMAVAGGAALGFAWAFIALGAIREAVRIAECDPVFKTLPVMLFSMGMFALALYGFVLL